MVKMLAVLTGGYIGLWAIDLIFPNTVVHVLCLCGSAILTVWVCDHFRAARRARQLAFDTCVLGSVSRHLGTATAVTVQDDVEAALGHEINGGAIYAGLDRLRAKGLIVDRWSDPLTERNGKRQRYYAVGPVLDQLDA